MSESRIKRFEKAAESIGRNAPEKVLERLPEYRKKQMRLVSSTLPKKQEIPVLQALLKTYELEEMIKKRLGLNQG